MTIYIGHAWLKEGCKPHQGIYDQFMHGNYDLSDQNGRKNLSFVPSQTAYDHLVQNGHRFMTKAPTVKIKRSLVSIFLVPPDYPRYVYRVFVVFLF
jgi:hypothetical protein